MVRQQQKKQVRQAAQRGTKGGQGHCLYDGPLSLERQRPGRTHRQSVSYLFSFPPTMSLVTLDYLDFDYSEDEEGTSTWDALASVSLQRLPALVSEVEALLRWALQDFSGRQGAQEEGGDWDFDLQASNDQGLALPLHWEPRPVHLHVSAAPQGHTTLALSLSGNAAFAQALRQHFDLGQ